MPRWCLGRLTLDLGLLLGGLSGTASGSTAGSGSSATGATGGHGSELGATLRDELCSMVRQ